MPLNPNNLTNLSHYIRVYRHYSIVYFTAVSLSIYLFAPSAGAVEYTDLQRVSWISTLVGYLTPNPFLCK